MTPSSVRLTVCVPTLLVAGHESLENWAWVHFAAFCGLPRRPGGRFTSRSLMVSEPPRSNESVKLLLAPAFVSAGFAWTFDTVMSACAAAGATNAAASASDSTRRLVNRYVLDDRRPLRALEPLEV